MSRIYNPITCERKIRASFVDKWGRLITMTGQHAFEYNIVIQDKNKLTSYPYNNGREARKAYNELQKKR